MAKISNIFSVVNAGHTASSDQWLIKTGNQHSFLEPNQPQPIQLFQHNWGMLLRILHQAWGMKESVCGSVPCTATLSEEIAHSTVYQHIRLQSSCIKTAKSSLRWRYTVERAVISESVEKIANFRAYHQTHNQHDKSDSAITVCCHDS